MTTLLTWKGVDSKQIASIYVASDSRFSWTKNKWDHGQKIFGSSKFPEILAYCGDVTIANNLINSLINLIDEEVIFSNSEQPEYKITKVQEYINAKFSDYPESNNTIILYIGKTGKEYFYYEIKYFNRIWSSVNVDVKVPFKSDLINVYGTGSASFNEFKEKYKNADSEGTSRHIYMTLQDSIESGLDPYSGRSPQLVGLYCGLNYPINFGIIHKQRRYYKGLELGVDTSFALSKLEWRNEDFERCDPYTLEILNGAQRQPRSRHMKKTT